MTNEAKNAMRHRELTAFFTLLCVLMLASCEVDTRVRVSNDNPPKFTFSGSGVLAQLYVTGPFTLDELKMLAGDKPITTEERAKIQQVIGNDRILWQLNPTRRQSITRLSEITYGVVPEGFTQVYPKDNQKPLPLSEGNYYSVYPPSYNANHRTTDFLVQNGQIVEVTISQ